jgi:hypothetical protein
MTEIIHSPDARRFTTSPWGEVEHVTQLADGIWQIDTASHGGIFLSDQRMAEMPVERRKTKYSKGGRGSRKIVIGRSSRSRSPTPSRMSTSRSLATSSASFILPWLRGCASAAPLARSEEATMSYQRIINEIDPTVNAREIEAFMRSQYGTLDHLNRDDFRREIRLAKACERQRPGFLALLASTY